MNEFLELIYQFGVLPILLLIMHRLHIRVKELNEELKEKNKEMVENEKRNNEEMRLVEKESTGLLYKSIASINKISKILKKNLDEE